MNKNAEETEKKLIDDRCGFEDDGEMLNAETVEAIDEVKKMKAGQSIGKTYSDVDQMMNELLANG